MRGYEITVRKTVITLIITLPGKTRRRRNCAGENRKHALLVSHLHALAFPDFVGTDSSKFSIA